MGLFTVHNQEGGGVHIFSKHKSNMYTFVQPRGAGGVYIFPYNTKVPCILLYNKGGWGPVDIRKIITNFCGHVWGAMPT